jgi:hypothetical protein
MLALIFMGAVNLFAVFRLLGGGDDPRQVAATEADCESALDKLDEQFNTRRKARQETFFNSKASKRFSSMKQITFWDKYEPEANCFDDERFGGSVRYKSLGDGPKFVCGVDFIAKKGQNEGCLVYSVGSNNDISFESAVKSTMGCEIHTFDPTVPTAKFVGNNVATFHEWGFGKDGSELGPAYKSAATVIKELGHTGRTIDIFKIDCEGCEGVVMPPLLESIANGDVQVNQVQIELHQLEGFANNAAALENFFSAVDKANFRIFHKERNHWGCQGYLCLEYSLVNEKFLRDVNGEYVCRRV